jgi:hypothetical protein
MYTTGLSPRFASAVIADHDIVTYFEIWKPGVTNGPAYTSVDNGDSCVIIDGNITLTKGQDQRGQCSLTLATPDGSLVPTTGTSPLTPWGNEIRIFSGLSYPDGTTEYVPMGCYRINQVEIIEANGAIQITVNGYDRSRNVSRNVVQYLWPSGSLQATYISLTAAGPLTWPQMIQTALQDRWSNITFNDTWQNWIAQENNQVDTVFLANGALPGPFSEGSDIWDEMRQYAQAAGCDMWFDRVGECVLKSDPVLTFFSALPPSPVVTFVEGVNAQFDQLQRNLDDATAFNRVVIYGAGDILGVSLSSYVYFGSIDATTGVSTGILADDNDPNSPTYIGTVDMNPANLTYGQVISPGPYGVVSNIVTNNLLTSQNQVNNFATLTIRQNIGSGENVIINSMLTDPRIEVDDCVTVTRDRDGLIDVAYLVQSVTIPLSMKSAMQMTLREKRNLS